MQTQHFYQQSRRVYAYIDIKIENTFLSFYYLIAISTMNERDRLMIILADWTRSKQKN